MIGKRDVRLNIEEETWKRVAVDLPGKDDDQRLMALLSRYDNIVARNEKRASQYRKAVSRVKDLKAKLEHLRSENEDLLSRRSDLEKEINSLKRKESSLQEEIERLKANPVTVEKVVYRENEQVVADLKEKRDNLQKKLWENEKVVQELEQELTTFREETSSAEHRRLSEYALLVSFTPNEGSSDYSFSVETITLGEFNKLLRSKEEFCKFKRIKTPSVVWRLWDRGTSPDDLVSITTRELKRTDDRTLDQVTIPMFQYKTLRSFEDKYNEAIQKVSALKARSEELERSNMDMASVHEAQRSELEDLRAEVRALKEAPPSIEYRDSPATKKRLEELRMENERLQMQVIESEATAKRNHSPIHRDGPQKGPSPGSESFIKTGDRFNVTIEGLGRNGDGFTKLRNYVIFIPDTKIGENLEVEVTKTTRRCGFARPLR